MSEGRGGGWSEFYSRGTRGTGIQGGEGAYRDEHATVLFLLRE